MKTSLIILTSIMLAAVLVACSPAQAPVSSSERFGYLYPTGSNGTFSGQPFSFDNGAQLTSALNVGYATEMAVWVNCSNVNVTALSYRVSPNNLVWSNGAVAMTACLNNLSKYDLTDKGVQYIRFNITANNGTNASVVPQAAASLMIAVSTK